MRRPSRYYQQKSYEDGVQEELHKASRDRLVAAIKELLEGDKNRMLKTLTPLEVDYLAGAAVGGYCIKRAEIEQWELENPDKCTKVWELFEHDTFIFS